MIGLWGRIVIGLWGLALMNSSRLTSNSHRILQFALIGNSFAKSASLLVSQQLDGRCCCVSSGWV